MKLFCFNVYRNRVQFNWDGKWAREVWFRVGRYRVMLFVGKVRDVP